MTGNDRSLDLDDAFRKTGLIAVAGDAPPGTLPVFSPSPACTHAEDGRVDRTVDHGTPGLVELVNCSWLELAEQYGLFGPNGEFLVLCRNGDNPPFWHRVRLAPEWDFAGAGAATGYFGYRAGSPELSTMSLNSRVMVQITNSDVSVSAIALPNPGRAGIIRDHLIRAAPSRYSPTQTWTAAQWPGNG